MGGWVSADDFAVFERLVQRQDSLGLAGNFCEIGVFEGKRFLFFLLSLAAGETALAIDVFDDTEPKRDFEPVFRANLLRHAGGMDGTAILRRDSASVRAEELLQVLGGRARIFSVDGCHSAPAAQNDIALASATLVRGGLLIVDDYFNEDWPGVSEGTLRFLLGPGGQASELVAFAVFSTKLFLTHREFAPQYRDDLRDWPKPYEVSEADFLGQVVSTLHQPRPVSGAIRLARSPVWRLIRNTPLGSLVRRVRRAVSG